MDKYREMIQRLLDGELSEADREQLLRRAEADPELKRELEGLSRAVGAVRQSPRMMPPPAFTQAVMRRLPARAPSFVERVRDFLLRGRTLRWNMAMALATAAVLIITSLTVLRWRDEGAQTALRAGREQASVTVRLSFYAPQARQVAVAGDFNRWQGDAHVMSKQDGGVWTIDLALEPGVYSYMFVLDGRAWVTDPGAETYEDDGFGNKNAVMRIGI